jgi:hypothetical protein
MDIVIPEKKSKTEIIQSDLFRDSDKVICDFIDSRDFPQWSIHKDPVEHALQNLGLIEYAVDLIAQTPNNSLLAQMKNYSMLDDIGWNDKFDSACKLVDRIKQNWEDLDGILVSLRSQDKIISIFTVDISLETTYGSIKILDSETLEKWEYTIFTQYGEYQV